MGFQSTIGFPCMYLVVLSLLQRSTRRQSLAIVLGVTFAVLIGVIGLPGPVNHTRLTGLALVVLSVPAALGAQNIRSKVGQLAILVSIVGLSHWTNRLHQEEIPQDTHKPILSEWAKALAFELECNPSQDNCGRMIALDDNLIPNTASLAHLRDLRGYDLPVSRQTRQLMAGLQSPPQSPWFPIKTQPSEALLSFANVRAVVTDSQQIEWLDKDSPRAWFTPCYQSVADSQAALQMVSVKI